LIFVAWPRTPDVVRSGPLCFHHINLVTLIAEDYRRGNIDQAAAVQMVHQLLGSGYRRLHPEASYLWAQQLLDDTLQRIDMLRDEHPATEA